MPEGVRVHKALADAGVASRRAAEALVAAGRVTVNEAPARIGQLVLPGRDRLAVDGRPVPTIAGRTYLVLNKPPGVTSTVSDRHAATTVLDLVPGHLRASLRLFPVGRLDRDSEGLLLLTDDGAWAHRLLHPRYEVEREYAVGLAAPLDEDQAERLRHGITLEEGVARVAGLRHASRTEGTRLDRTFGPGRGSARAPEPRRRQGLTWYHVTLRQGWRRQVRRMFGAVGAPVERLVRVRVGSLRLGDLASGEVRVLTRQERDRLATGAPGPERARDRQGTERQAPDDPGRLSRHRDDQASRPERGGLVVSLDGPGSSGKSSVGTEVATRLGYRFLDTGVLYRAIAWLCARRGLDPDDDEALVRLIPELELVADKAGRMRRVRVAGRDISGELHAPDVDRLVSRVAARSPLRGALLPLQREIARPGRIIVAGRDIGSVVLPDADLKLYLDVSLDERAQRRVTERGVSDGSDEALAIRADLASRDRADSQRQTAPLRVPDDAVVVRSDGLTFEDTVARVLDVVRSREAS